MLYNKNRWNYQNVCLWGICKDNDAVKVIRKFVEEDKKDDKPGTYTMHTKATY